MCSFNSNTERASTETSVPLNAHKSHLPSVYVVWERERERAGQQVRWSSMTENEGPKKGEEFSF